MVHQQGPEPNNDQQMAAAAPKSYQESADPRGELKKEIISKCFHSLKLGFKIPCLFIRTAVKTFQDRTNF